MFSIKEKMHIAAEIEKLLLSLNHPEMPKKKPIFKLHVDGTQSWSWSDIIPNWLVKENSELSDTNSWNEVARDVMKKDKQSKKK